MKNEYFKGGIMKNIIFILLFSTTIFAQSAVSLYEESQKALSSGNLELAGEKIKAAIDLDKTNDSFRKEFDRLNGLRNKMINSNRSVQDGRFDDAITGFAEVIAGVPNSVEAYYGTAKAYEGKKDFTSAVKYYKQSLAIDSGYQKSKTSISNVAKKLYNSANQDYKNGNLESALSKYQQVLGINSRLYQAYFQMGVLQKKMGNLSLAIENYQSALRIKKTFDKGWYNLGLAYKENGDIDNAKESFEETVRLNKKYYKAHKSLGEIFIDLEKYEDAILSFKTAIDIKPKYGAAYHAMGITYAKLEDYSRSAESLAKAVDLQPKEYLSWFHLSEAHNKLNDCEAAKAAALETIDLKKNFGGGWFELGIAEYCGGKGNKNTSINHFEKARNDRNWRKMAEYEIDRVRNPEKYEG